MIKRFLSNLFGFRSDRQAQTATRPQIAPRSQQRDEWREKALANFPFEIVETSGENALAKWEELKNSGRGVPVVVGKDLEHILGPFHPEQQVPLTPVSETLATAARIVFPEDLFVMRRNEHAAGLAALGNAYEDEEDAPLGEWPAEASSSPGLFVAYDPVSGKPLAKVYIVLIPTDDPTAIPAHLHWGDWNACPAPEYHVAALRHWRDRYGAELVGLGHDTMSVRVARKPVAREEAIELARVQYAYCNDIVDQGTGSYNGLAAELMAHDWWFFWWD
jgi:hypothetical protein